MTRSVVTRSLMAFGLAALSCAALGAPVVFSAAAATAAGIQPTVDSFRAALGTLNPNTVGSAGSGRREINWDGVPDASSAPNNLPANFFNSNSPRGVVLSTPGTGFQVSATAASGTPVQFGNIDPGYPSFFEPFSAQRLFTALGSTITDVTIFVPGTATPASTNAFGVVFSDVDSANVSSLEFFNESNVSLGTFFAPNFGGNETFSFVGVRFDAGEKVSRVRITSGNQVLAAGNVATDLVVMDDFIYAEPVALDTTSPTVTVNQAAGQADPTGDAVINFTVIFSEPVTGFTSGDVTLGGTAGATTAIVTGSGTTYNVAVSGMTQPGSVIVTIPAGAAVDAGLNPSLASTSFDNQVEFARTSIPTLSQWALLLMALALAVAGGAYLRRGQPR